MMWFFNEEEILLLHYKTIEQFGGSHGIRDLGRLKSALTSPKTKYDESVTEKAAVYSRSIIGDHPFIDGNKRTGIMASVIFLEKNSISLSIRQGELEDFAVKIAIEKLDVQQIAKWLKSKSK